MPALTTPIKPVRARLHIKDLANLYGVTERTIYTYHHDGTIPWGRYLPGKSWPFWYEEEIEQNERFKPRLQQKRQRVVDAAKLSQPQPRQTTLF